MLLEGEPCNIVANEFVKPGKGQAFNRVRLRNLRTGRMWERTFKSGESIEAADVLETGVDYLYNDGSNWHFMHPDSYDQYQFSIEQLGDLRQWLVENSRCLLTLWNGQPLGLELPNFVDLRVTETDPGVRGDTATGGTKPATLETGAVVRVPLFIETGELLRIDTRTGEYQSRSKE